MALDTAKKRHSALTFRRHYPPLPDGTIDQADRQTLIGLYGGILAQAIVFTGEAMMRSLIILRGRE